MDQHALFLLQLDHFMNWTSCEPHKTKNKLPFISNEEKVRNQRKRYELPCNSLIWNLWLLIWCTEYKQMKEKQNNIQLNIYNNINNNHLLCAPSKWTWTRHTERGLRCVMCILFIFILILAPSVIVWVSVLCVVFLQSYGMEFQRLKI